MPIAVPLFVSLGLLLTMTSLSVGLGVALPPDTLLPIHFNFVGAPDNFASKTLALSLLPIAIAVATIIFALGPRINRRINAIPGTYTLIWLFVVLALAVGHGFIIRGALFALQAASAAA